MKTVRDACKLQPNALYNTIKARRVNLLLTALEISSRTNKQEKDLVRISLSELPPSRAGGHLERHPTKLRTGALSSPQHS